MITQQVATATISVEYEGHTYTDDLPVERRERYKYLITTPEWQYVGNDLHSPESWEPQEDEAFDTLLSFLSAAGEGMAYEMRTSLESENASLFPPHVTEWAYQHLAEMEILYFERKMS